QAILRGQARLSFREGIHAGVDINLLSFRLAVVANPPRSQPFKSKLNLPQQGGMSCHHGLCPGGISQQWRLKPNDGALLVITRNAEIPFRVGNAVRRSLAGEDE